MHLRSDKQKKNGSNLKTRRNSFLVLVVILAASVVSRNCNAQSDQNSSVALRHDDPVNSHEWPKVRQNVQFMDGKSAPVSGLVESQVLILEDGVKQPEVELVEDSRPASICLLLDESSSMKQSSKNLTSAVERLVGNANPADEFELVTFDARVVLAQDFTTDRTKIESALQHIEYGGASVLFDAVGASITQLNARPSNRRKVLIIFSDGNNNYSHAAVGDIVRKLRSIGGPLIYTLSPSSQPNSGRQNLQALSNATGGLSYAVDHPNLLDDKALEISRDIHTRYSLEYTSTHPERNGKLHKVEIKVASGASASKVRPFFQQEYYAPSQ